MTTVKNKTSFNVQMRIVSNGMSGNHTTTTDNIESSSDRIDSRLKRNGDIVNRRLDDEKLKRAAPHFTIRQNSLNLTNSRIASTTIERFTHVNLPKYRYSGSKVKNYPPSDGKADTANQYDYKTSSKFGASTLSLRLANNASAQNSYRDNNTSFVSRATSHIDRATLIAAGKALDQRNIVGKIASINFPPLGASHNIVDVGQPFVTESRTKHTDARASNVKSMQDANSLQSSAKELSYTRSLFHSYGTSQINGVPSIQNLANVAASISPFVRSDSYRPSTVANVLFPETAQFSQSSSYNAAQVGQLNQYGTYDHTSYASTPVNVNTLMTRYSTENSLRYQQYENSPQFVQPNHYATTDITSNRYQYQAAGVGQLQETPLFLQSLQSPIAVTDQYTAASNFPRALRTELIPRPHRPPRFNK